MRRRALHTSIGQVREIRYRAIADDLRRRVEAGEFAAGRTAAERGRAVGSVRGQPGHDPQGARAAARRGAGRRPPGLRLVRGRRPAAPVARPARHHRGAAGRVRACGPSGASSTSGSCRRRRGSGRCSASTTVLEVRRLNLADGEPFARVTVWCPERPRRAPVARRRRAGVVLRADRPAARRRGADDRRRGGRRARRRAARGAGGVAGAALRADHLGPRRAARCW